MLEVLAVVVGALLALGVTAAAVEAFVSTRLRRRRRRRTPAEKLAALLWWLFGALADRVRDERLSESILSTFAPVYLLLVISSWIVVQVLGWGLVWWGLGGTAPDLGLLDAFYFSGVTYFTVGFGEVVPVEGWARAVALLEAFNGVVIVALTIGYLPTLYGAYAERERQLLLLDDGLEERMTPLSLLVEQLDGTADMARTDEFFAEWERWCAATLESHTSHPMLAFFRSQHPGQSWVTALGLVVDTCVVRLVADGLHGPAFRCYRRATRLLTLSAELLGVEPKAQDPIDREVFRNGHEAWVGSGLDVPPFDHAYEAMHELRRPYVGQLEGLIDELRTPRGFWGFEIGLRREAVGAGAEALARARAARDDREAGTDV